MIAFAVVVFKQIISILRRMSYDQYWAPTHSKMSKVCLFFMCVVFMRLSGAVRQASDLLHGYIRTKLITVTACAFIFVYVYTALLSRRGIGAPAQRWLPLKFCMRQTFFMLVVFALYSKLKDRANDSFVDTIDVSSQTTAPSPVTLIQVLAGSIGLLVFLRMQRQCESSI